MGWGFGWSGGGGSSKKKKAKKHYANWFERLTSVQLKELLSVANLPVSGSKAKQTERLLACPVTKMYAAEHDGKSWAAQSDDYRTVEQLKTQCRDIKLSPGGSKYELVLRLIGHHKDTDNSSDNTSTTTNKRLLGEKGADETGNESATKKRKTSSSSIASGTTKIRKILEGEALEKRTAFRFKKLNKQIDDRLKWKDSFRYMNGIQIKGCRVEIECSEPEVFEALFGGTSSSSSSSSSTESLSEDDSCSEPYPIIIKKSSNGKLSRSFQTDDEICDSGKLHGKYYRYGANAILKVPASVSLHNGKLSFSFKYTVTT